MAVIRAAVLTVSDRVACGKATDRSGARVQDLLEGSGEIAVSERSSVADDQETIRGELLRLAVTSDLIVTTGGTGLGPRDVTPEATLEVIERRLPGLEEAMRAEGRLKTPLAMLSRAVVGSRGRCLVVNLPGSPGGVEDGLRAILAAIPHAVDLIRASVSDCSSVRREFEGQRDRRVRT